MAITGRVEGHKEGRSLMKSNSGKLEYFGVAVAGYEHVTEGSSSFHWRRSKML